jgi:hypothetical protein
MAVAAEGEPLASRPPRSYHHGSLAGFSSGLTTFWIGLESPVVSCPPLSTSSWSGLAAAQQLPIVSGSVGELIWRS